MLAGGVERLPRRHGSREGTPPNPTLCPLASASCTTCAAAFTEADASPCADACPSVNASTSAAPGRVECSHISLRAEPGWGGGHDPQARVFWGSFFEAPNQHFVAGLSGPGE